MVRQLITAKEHGKKIVLYWRIDIVFKLPELTAESAKMPLPDPFSATFVLMYNGGYSSYLCIEGVLPPLVHTLRKLYIFHYFCLQLPTVPEIQFRPCAIFIVSCVKQSESCSFSK